MERAAETAAAGIIQPSRPIKVKRSTDGRTIIARAGNRALCLNPGEAATLAAKLVRALTAAELEQYRQANARKAARQ